MFELFENGVMTITCQHRLLSFVSSDDSDGVSPHSLNFSNSSSSDSDDDRVLSSVSKRVHSVRVGSKIMKNLMIDFMWGKSRSYLEQGRCFTVLITMMVMVRP